MTDELLSAFGLAPEAKATAVKIEGIRMGDWDDEITYRVYLTNDDDSIDYGEIEYFDEDYDAEEFAENYAKAYKLKYLGIGDE